MLSHDVDMVAQQAMVTVFSLIECIWCVHRQSLDEIAPPMTHIRNVNIRYACDGSNVARANVPILTGDTARVTITNIAGAFGVGVNRRFEIFGVWPDESYANIIRFGANIAGDVSYVYSAEFTNHDSIESLRLLTELRCFTTRGEPAAMTEDINLMMTIGVDVPR